jgi:hypothetical protein
LPEISALSKWSEQDHCHGGDTDSQGTTYQVVVSAHRPVDVVDVLHKIGSSPCAPLEQSSIICGTFPYVVLLGSFPKYSASLTDTTPLSNFENQLDIEVFFLFPLLKEVLMSHRHL